MEKGQALPPISEKVASKNIKFESGSISRISEESKSQLSASSLTDEMKDEGADPEFRDN